LLYGWNKLPGSAIPVRPQMRFIALPSKKKSPQEAPGKTRGRQLSRSPPPIMRPAAQLPLNMPKHSEPLAQTGRCGCAAQECPSHPAACMGPRSDSGAGQDRCPRRDRSTGSLREHRHYRTDESSLLTSSPTLRRA
jgi:hypothetical protein